MKKIMKILFLIPLLICSISSASQPENKPNETDKASISQQSGTKNSPIFIQFKETEEEKQAKVDEVMDRKQNLVIQAEVQKVAEETLKATKDASDAASLAAIVGIAMAVIAGVQIFMFFWQLRVMGSANKTAATAAKAALVQAQTVMDAERAYVKILHLKPGLRTINEHSSVVEVEVTNLGRTPAQVTDAEIDFKFLEYGDPLPIPYPFRPIKRESFPNGFLMPNELIHVSRHVNTKQALATGKQLWVFGHVDYIDVFNRRWRGGYARKYQAQDGDNLVYNTEARDNFDQERTPGEGRDWDEESIAAYKVRKKASVAT